MKIRLVLASILLLLCLQVDVMGQEPISDENTRAFWQSLYGMYDQWDRPEPERLQTAYSKLLVVMQQRPTEPVYVQYKILFLAEMGRWSELRAYLEELSPAAASSPKLHALVEHARIHLEARQKGLLGAFSVMSLSSRWYFLTAVFGSAFFLTMLSLITALAIRRKPQLGSEPLVTATLLVAWTVPLSQLLIVSLLGGLYPIRPYDCYRQETIDYVVQSAVFLALALFYMRRHSCSLNTGGAVPQKVAFAALAVLLPVLGYLPYLSWQIVEGFPQIVADLPTRGISGFFGLFALLGFVYDVGFGLLVYCVLYRSIRSLTGPIAGAIWLLIWLNALHLSRYLTGDILPSMWMTTCFSIAPIFAYEALPSRIAPVATLWWISVLTVAYGIARSGGWNPSLL